MTTIHGLSERVAELLDRIHLWVAEHGTPPTYDEMAVDFGRSRATVDHYLAVLEARGWLTRSGRHHRGAPTVTLLRPWSSTTSNVRELTGSTRT